MLFYRLRLGSPRGPFPSGLLTKFLYKFLFCLVRAWVFVCLLSANYDHTIRPDIFKPMAFFLLFFWSNESGELFFRDD